MKTLFTVIFLNLISMATSAQPANQWRVSKKTFIAANGQQYVTEFDYSVDGRIKTVRNLSASGTITTTSGNFQFGRNNKPSAYTVTYNREGGQVNVTVQYDNSGRVTELVKTISSNDVTVYTYRYTGTTTIITEKKAKGQSSISNGKISTYTEQGDYSETLSDAASQLITTTITHGGRRNPELEPWPEHMMGGYETPLFFGTQAYGSAPKVTSTKNSEGLITSLSLATGSSTRKFEYAYIKVGGDNEESPSQTGTKITIATNINCNDGKLQVERILRSMDGVFASPVDIKTGKIALNYSPDGTPYADIIKAINDAGFDADGKKSASPANNPCSKVADPKDDNTRQTGRNIFDARKGFKKTPIKFVPFVITPDAAKKGFKMDSVYTWTAPDGKVKTASGAEILQQVNDMEKELNFRGHTLRNRDGFRALTYKMIDPKALLKMPKVTPKKTNVAKLNDGMFNKLPVIKTKHNKLPATSIDFSTVIGSDVGVYFGRITSNSGEFQGNISTSSFIDNTKCSKDCPLDVVVSLDAKKIGSLNITNCVLEISANPDRKPNDNETPLATANFNFKKPAKTKKGIENMSVSGDAPPSFHTLYYFPVKLNDLSKLSKAAIKPVPYYAYLKFYNDKGQLLYYSSYNTAILESKIDVPLFIAQDKKVTGNFDDAYTDPTGLFGMYYKSNNITASYKTTRDEETMVITESTRLSGDVEIGAQYYNFWRLLNEDLSKYERKPVIKASFSSSYDNRYGLLPSIRVPGYKSNDMNNYPGYQVNYSLFNGKEDINYDKTSKPVESISVPYNIFDERFFIGPVPCRITVDISGNAGFTRQATMDTLTNGNVSLSTSVIPHLDLTLTGKGGVDAAIAYAKIVADVKVIEVDMPITVKAASDADIDAAIKVTALSGQIYFTAGLCIPIPWFDDICTDFRIDIFNWTGPSKTYPIIK